MIVGIVGPCKSGKSTLQRGLRELGFQGKQIAQEHSFSPSMWQVFTKPDLLIFLEVSYLNTLSRGQLKWREIEYEEQLKRLAHAREHADLIINTNHKSIEEVKQEAIQFISKF